MTVIIRTISHLKPRTTTLLLFVFIVQVRTSDLLDYNDSSELYSFLWNITERYPNTSTLKEIGRTYENRPIHSLKIFKGSSVQPKIMIVEFGIHAREWVSHTSATFVISELLGNPKYDDLITNVTWYIIPLLNPDGFVFSKINRRMWRKNRKPAKDVEVCVGVDINRNFPAAWSASHTCDNVYSGPGPLSESESAALDGFLKQFQNETIDAYISVHSSAQMIVLPYAYTREQPLGYNELVSVANKIKNALESLGPLRYKVVQASSVYMATGTVFDWVYDYYRVPLVFTLELPFSDRDYENTFSVNSSEKAMIAVHCLVALKTCAQHITGLNSAAISRALLPIPILSVKMIKPMKIGINAEPPAIVFVYKMWGRIRKRTMPIRNLWPTTSAKFILEDIRARHDILLGVQDDVIIKMVNILKAVRGGMELDDAVDKFRRHEPSVEEQFDENHNDSLSLGEKILSDKGVDKLKVSSKACDNDSDNEKKKKEKPYSFMDKRMADEDTDFDPNDDLPLDELDGHSDDDFWR